jgi:hypothetical protein
MKPEKVRLVVIALLMFLQVHQCDAEGFLAGTLVKNA